MSGLLINSYHILHADISNLHAYRKPAAESCIYAIHHIINYDVPKNGKHSRWPWSKILGYSITSFVDTNGFKWL